MFELEPAITRWRKQMSAMGIKSRPVLDELEGHLQEDVERQVQSGLDVEQAFHAAVLRIGQPGVLTDEFSKIGDSNDYLARIKNVLLTLAGIPNLTLATNMNSSTPNQNVEPAWATYLKSGAFLLPAVSLWLVVVFFIFPKFNQICHQAGVAIPAVYYLVLSLVQQGVWIALAIVAALVLLEWRSEKWPRYRRATFGVGAFVVNSAAMILITVMVIYAIVAAASVANQMK